jgi:hypothetical protein
LIARALFNLPKGKIVLKIIDNNLKLSNGTKSFGEVLKLMFVALIF